MMIKQKKILINFILWFIGLFLVCCVGISNVFALEYSTTYADIQYYYDNFGSSATLINSTWNSSLNAYVSSNLGTTANSYGGLVVFNSPIPIIANHTYTVSFSFIERYNIALSSKPNLAIGNTYDGTKYNYVNNQNYATTLVHKVVNNAILQYSFTATGGASYIAIPWTTTSNTTQTYVFNSIIIEDLGSEGVSAQTIQDKLDAQAYNINQTIEYMQEQIILNQNSNNQAVISSIDENLNSCRASNNLIPFTDQDFTLNGVRFVVRDGSLFFDGTSIGETSSTNVNYKNKFRFNLSAGTYTISHKTGLIAVRLNNYLNDSNIVVLGSNTLSTTFTLNEDSNVYLGFYMYRNSFSNINSEIMISKNGGAYESYGQKCSNKIDDATNAINGTTNAINGLNDNINNDNTDGATSEASDFFSDFSTNTFGLTSIITAPLNLIQSLTSKTCTPLHLPLPYLNNKYLDLPCMSTLYSEYFGNFYTLYQTITYGIIAYWVCVRIFNLVKDFKNPEHDEIEVVDL